MTKTKSSRKQDLRLQERRKGGRQHGERAAERQYVRNDRDKLALIAKPSRSKWATAQYSGTRSGHRCARTEIYGFHSSLLKNYGCILHTIESGVHLAKYQSPRPVRYKQGAVAPENHRIIFD